MSQKVERLTLTECMYSALKQNIFDFMLLPGDQFTENEVAQHMIASGNEEMVRVHQNVTERLRIIRRIDFTQRSRIEAIYQERAKILRTIIKRRAGETQRRLKPHIEKSPADVRKITLHMLHKARQAQRSRSTL